MNPHIGVKLGFEESEPLHAQQKYPLKAPHPSNRYYPTGFRIAEFSLQVFQLQNFKGQIKHHLPRHEALYICNSMAAPSSTPLAVLDNLRRPFPAAAQNS
nr:hypothetical protein Iba_chr12eCG7910 [Ipomoea batatas]